MKKTGTGTTSGTVGWPAMIDSGDENSKSRPCKNLASLNLESGMTFFAKKDKKRKKRITADTQ